MLLSSTTCTMTKSTFTNHNNDKIYIYSYQWQNLHVLMIKMAHSMCAHVSVKLVLVQCNICRYDGKIYIFSSYNGRNYLFSYNNKGLVRSTCTPHAAVKSTSLVL